jgi:glutaconate CoA-transferase subunit B
MVITPQDNRRFVEKVDYITTPGWLEGGDSRERSGLPLGTGPYRIITNMALMGFDEETKRMKVLSLNPGYTRKDVQDNCGFELLWADDLGDTPPPEAGELEILRNQIDPFRYVIGRG